MKKLILLLSLLAGAAAPVVAQVCDHVDVKKDAFTGKAIRTGRVIVGNARMRWVVNINQSDGKTTMLWEIAVDGELNQALPTGTKLMLKLDNGKVLDFATIEPTAPVTKAFATTAVALVFSTLNLKFELSKEDLKGLSSGVITDIKLDVPGLTVKYPKLKGGQVNRVADIADCLLYTY